MQPIPAGFVREMTDILGQAEASRLLESLEQTPSAAIRLNPSKPCVLPDSLKGEEVEWCSDGRRLSERPAFTLMPQLHAGGFYVQDPSSMVIGGIVRQVSGDLEEKPLRMLDACAAPGGKSTAAISALPAGSLLVANEFDPRRAQILAENLTKWGNPNTVVTQGDTSRFRSLRESFDIVLVDAPCSGEGMMRKDDTARAQWSEGLVTQCERLGREILENVWDSLRPGGFLIFSTCTFNTRENELQALDLISRTGAESIPITWPQEVAVGHSLHPDLHALRFMPHLTRGEGLFVTLLRKPGEWKPSHTSPRKTKAQKTPAQFSRWLADPEAFSFRRDPNGHWEALPLLHTRFIEDLSKKCRLLQAGLPLAQEKGRDLIPDHALALTSALAPEAFPRVEVSQEQAIAYLRREAILPAAEAERGFIIPTYAGLPLGFLKNLGNRANNLYPQNWRIRMS